MNTTDYKVVWFETNSYWKVGLIGSFVLLNCITDSTLTSSNTNGGHLEPMGPFSVADRSDAVWLRDDFVPSFAAVVEDVVIALEDAV